MMVDASLATASILLLAVGAAHSILGERYIISRVLHRPQPQLFGNDLFTKRTLRFAWHLTTIAWFGFGALLGVFALELQADPVRIVGSITSATLAATAVAIAVGSRARHPAWLVFALAAVLAWVGTV